MGLRDRIRIAEPERREEKVLLPHALEARRQWGMNSDGG